MKKKPHFEPIRAWVVTDKDGGKGIGLTPKSAMADKKLKLKAKQDKKDFKELMQAEFDAGVSAESGLCEVKIKALESTIADLSRRLQEFSDTRSDAEGWLMMAMAFTGQRSPDQALQKLPPKYAAPPKGYQVAKNSVEAYMKRWVAAFEGPTTAGRQNCPIADYVATN